MQTSFRRSMTVNTFSFYNFVVSSKNHVDPIHTRYWNGYKVWSFWESPSSVSSLFDHFSYQYGLFLTNYFFITADGKAVCTNWYFLDCLCICCCISCLALRTDSSSLHTNESKKIEVSEGLVNAQTNCSVLSENTYFATILGMEK